MKVAFITHYTSLYGANRSLLNLIDGLAPLGVESFVVAPHEGDLIQALQERGVPSLLVPHQQWSSVLPSSVGLRGRLMRYINWRREALRRLRTNLYIAPSVIRQMERWGIDVVYTNSSVIPLGSIVATCMEKPHVWHLREFGDLDYDLTFDWGKAVVNYFISRADAQICISESIRSHFAKGLRIGRSHVVYNGVATIAEMDSYHSEVALRVSDSQKFVFALVGLIRSTKGQETAIRALALLKDSFPKAELMIAGGGSETKPLQELCEIFGISDRVLFCGYVDDPYDVYRKADAVLMCSKNEALGRVTIEAMSAAKPVIGYNAGGTPELIVHEFNGLLYDGEEEELACCMRRLIERPTWSRALGENAWKTAREKYSLETYAKTIYSVLTSLISGK